MGTNTGIGIGIGIPFKNFSSGGRQPLPPDLKASLKGVWIAYGKSNNDADRSIVKNLVDPDNPFVISNAAYEGMSGYNGYPVVFGANKTWEQMPTGAFTWNIDGNKLHITKALIAGHGLVVSYVKLNDSLLNVKEIPSFKIKVSGLEGKSKLWYRYLKTEDAISETIAVLENGTHELPKSCIPSDSLHGNVWIGFTVTPISEGVKEFDCDITIEVLPEYEGAFVTDGIDDLITSTKTVQEMLGGSNEITVVSMMANLDSRQILCNSNFSNTDGYNVRNTLEPNGVISMLGYTDKNGTTNNLNLIMGDKDSIKLVDKVNFNSDYVFYPAQYYKGYYQVAWYWTIIANKVLTTDQINQVIAYFNLDRTLKPDILCDVKKQGITNENHAEFGDKLIDFSGNGRDIQLNNIGWKLDSGIGKYETDFTTWTRNHFTDEVNFTPSKIEVTGILTTNSILINNKPTPIYNVEIHSPNKSIVVYYQYNDDTGVKRIALVDGINELPSANDSLFVTSDRLNSKGITITQIPSHAGALCLDGVNDFGKVTGMPIYKDYTVVADYERTDRGNIEGIGTSPVLSKSYTAGQGSFIINFIASAGNWSHSYSFGTGNTSNFNDLARQIFYQSKYKSQGFDITAGTGVDGDSLWLGTPRDNDNRFFNGAIYSLMSFPYSMSEFLIERQLKKYKLGTLYPDTVEFRPVIKGNVLLDAKPTFVIRGTSTYLNAGDYVPENSQIWASIKMNNIADRITKFTVNGKTIDIPENAYSEVTLQYGFPFVIDKFPQKISITIEQDENYVQ